MIPLEDAVDIVDLVYEAKSKDKVMTNEEAIREIESYMPKDEPMNTKDREAFFMAIKALKQEDILNKIRAEIAQYKRITYSTDPYNLVGYCLNIIDKHRKEQTDADSN